MTYTVILAGAKRKLIETMRKQKVEWDEQKIKLLGTDSDQNIAKQLGIGIDSVTYKRQKLGIPASRKKVNHNWTKEEIAQFGQISDVQLAKRIGVTRTCITLKRQKLGIKCCPTSDTRIPWTEDDIAQLGTIPDEQVAQKMGISITTVLRKRQSLGIAPYVHTERSRDINAPNLDQP